MKKLYILIILISCFKTQSQVVLIPDVNFKLMLLNNNSVNLNSDNEIQVSEAVLVTDLDVYAGNIDSLSGLEYFTALQIFNCSYNNLTSINEISGLTNLTVLDCNSNNITVLDPVYNLTNLTWLDCSFNQFNILNFVGLPNLQTLNCLGDTCVTITFNGQNSLKKLLCSGIFTTIDISGLLALEDASCGSINLSAINVGITGLKKLEVIENQLQSLDVTNLIFLEELNCSNALISSLLLGNKPNLKILGCQYNLLTNLDISGAPNLREFNCRFNQLTNLNIAGFTNLIYLVCNNNLLISVNTNIFNASLKVFHCFNNNLTALNTGVLCGLTELFCYNNAITSLDLQCSSSITKLYCDNNQLADLSIKNNSIESELFFDGNSNLQHICADAAQLTAVQNKVIAYGYTNCVVDSACSLSTTNPNSNLDFSIYPNPSNGRFTINYNNLDLNNSINLSVIDMQGRIVYAKENAITQQKTEINSENVLKAGVYFVKIYSNNFEKIVKIVVE